MIERERAAETAAVWAALLAMGAVWWVGAATLAGWAWATLMAAL